MLTYLSRCKGALALLSCLFAVATAGAADIPQAAYGALHWRNIGPFLGGRSIAVAGQASEPGTFFLGATGGGVWKTTDYGIHWKLSSGATFRTGSVGALAVAPSDPNVVYAGMGESAIRGDMATGDGIYKSTDGGKTWEHVGLEQTHVISDIVVDPRDPAHVWAAALGHVFGPNTQRGVFESEDGGTHWKRILYVDDQTGAIALTMDPNNPRILYAAMWQAYRQPWMLSSGGPGSGLYKTTDGGAHWTNLSQRPGLPQGVLGKIDIAVSGANSERVYALIEAKSGGVFRSDDGGETWQRVNHDSELTQRAWYFTRIYADPKAAETVYAPEVGGIFKSTDGGQTFKPLRPPHGDVHVLWVNPERPAIMITGNDGGASVSQDGGQSWSPEDNQPTAQFYHVDVDDQFPFHVYAAQQDRGPVEIPSRTDDEGITAMNMRELEGGESGFVVPVPGKPWITYAGSYDGSIVRYDRRTDAMRLVDVWPDNPMGHAASDLKYRFQWTFPMMISQYPPHALYVGAQSVLRSTDDGESWTQISPDLTRDVKAKQASSGGPLTQDNTSIEYYDTVFVIAESPVKQGVLWVGSDDGLVHVSKDDGKHWQDATPSGLPPFATISMIDPSHFDAGTAFLAARRYRQDDFKPYLYVTTDYGQHWRAIDHGLPEDESSFTVREDTQDPNLLFAGTMAGIYVSFDRGAHWQTLQLNLPHVPVHDMVITPRASALVLATHGRSFWVLDDLQPLREMSAQVAAAAHHLFQPQPAYLMHGSSDEQSIEHGYGENPPNGVVVYFTLKDAPPPKEKVSLTFATDAGKDIATFSNQTDAHGKPLEKNSDFYPPKKPQQEKVVPAKAGMNRFVWDMRYPDATEIKGAILWDGSISGPTVTPGKYQVTLKVGDASETRAFEIREDPHSDATPADLEAQLAFLRKVQGELDRTDRAILELRAVRKQIDDYLARSGQGDTGANAVRKAAKPIVDRLDAIEAALIQTKSHSDEDPLNYPIRLNNKLAALETDTGESFSRPTKQDYEVFTELSTQLDAQLNDLSAVLGQQLPALNRLIAQQHITPIAVPQTPKSPD